MYLYWQSDLVIVILSSLVQLEVDGVLVVRLVYPRDTGSNPHGHH